MGKKICAALLAVLLCVSALPLPIRAADTLESFYDLDRNAWYAPGVSFCLKHDLMTGYGDRIHRFFAPGAPVTRAQFVTILWRIAGEPKAGLAIQYNDVPEDAWYTEAVRWALAEDVLKGYTSVSFAPNDPITREQLTVILWEFTRYLNGSVPQFTDPGYEQYGDCGEVSASAESAMRWACGMGIINGYRSGDGYLLKPLSESSRAVVATMLMRYCIDLGLYD